MNIAIVDDRAEDRQELITLLERYCAQNSLDASWQSFSSGEVFLSAFAPGRYDLIFLDIYMGGKTGMEIARELVALDGSCRLIFFTTSSAHAVESYEVRAAYYLTKPLEYERLRHAMDVTCAALLLDSRALEVHCGGERVAVLLRDVLYADCSAEHTRLHLEERVMPVDERTSDILSRLLADGRFLNCNRNVAVNMDWIAKTQEGDFLLKNGEIVPIRQRGRGAVKKDFLRYSLRALRKEGAL